MTFETRGSRKPTLSIGFLRWQFQKNNPRKRSMLGSTIGRLLVMYRYVLALLCSVPFASVPLLAAEEISREQIKGLDEQIQEVKSDVLGIAAELSRLEEKLLYPSET